MEPPSRPTNLYAPLAGITGLPVLAVTLPNLSGLEGFGLPILLALDVALVAVRTSLDALRPVHQRTAPEGKPRERLTALIEARPTLAAGAGAASTLVRFALAILSGLLGYSIGGSVSDGWAVGGAVIAAAVIAIIDIVLTTGLARGIALARPVKVVTTLSWLAKAAAALLYLVVTPSAAIAVRLASRGITDPDSSSGTTEQEIKILVENSESASDIEEEERELIRSVFDFTDTVAREVMTPRTDLDALPIDVDPGILVQTITDTGHSRIPLYEETDDAIIGIVHAKDVLTALAEGRSVSPRELMRSPLFVPEGKGLRDLLAEMKASRTQLAVVQDEFGGTAGIVTIEDIVEELVGDIVDEYDDEHPPIVPAGEGWSVDGKTHLDDVSREIGLPLSSESFDTLGGYVFGLFGRQPKVGEIIEDGTWRFEVTETDGRRILRLSLFPLDPATIP